MDVELLHINNARAYDICAKSVSTSFKVTGKLGDNVGLLFGSVRHFLPTFTFPICLTTTLKLVSIRSGTLTLWSPRLC